MSAAGGAAGLPPGVVLAGGEGRRMGGADKALLPLAGRPMLDHVLERLRPQVSAIALGANGDPARFAGRGLEVLADPGPGGQGPLAGVLAALDWAAGLGAPAVVTVACDTPFFPRDLVARLRAAGAPLALAATDRRHPTFGLWPTALREDLRAALAAGDRKIALWADAHGAAAVPFEARGTAAADPFFNVNTPGDLALAEARAGRAP